ncbi:MAG TPA: methylthioribulose 1-phosphate dehydratase [Pirellulales bacterium]
MSTTTPETAKDATGESLLSHIDSLREVGRHYWSQGWSLGTSSNYSIRLSRDPFRLLITASGKDKSQLSREDFVQVDSHGKAVSADMPKPSAETMLHVVAAQLPEVGAVLHTHSIWSTILSDVFFDEGAVTIEGYEMLKGLEGIRTHETTFKLPIFDNTQDIAELSKRVVDRFHEADQPLRYGFLLRKHGLYTWGRDLTEAKRHVEIIEFLQEAVARRRMFR